MKLRKHRRDTSQPAVEKPGNAPVADKTSQVSKPQRWLFRLSAMVLAPLVLLGCLELTLRLAGYGYPTDFFLPTQINSADFYVPNPKFTFRFFPPALARPTLPIRFAANKSTNTYRIFLFGESAANGDPDPTFGVARYLQTLLRERFPKTDFEVLCVAITGINSHTIVPIARECARHQGDLWLIYMGNNEMVGPFGAETVFGFRAPSLSLVRAILAIKTTKTGQLLDALAERLKRPGSSPKTWGGMEMFVKNQVPYDAPARLRVYQNLRGNLEDILRAGRQAGVPVVLSTVAVNLRDCAPFASLHTSGLSTNQLVSWAQVYENGASLEAAGAYREALTEYQKAAAIDPGYAELQYRSGRCNLALTNNGEARRNFERARDYDALAFRADTSVNDVIRQTAARRASDGVYLLDAAEVLARQSPAGIPGSDFFYEHVHLNFGGNYLLALSFAEQVKRLLPSPILATDQGSWASEELCERRLAVTVWDRQRVWQPIFNRISSPPFTGQFDHDSFFKMCEAKLDEAKARMNSQTPEQARHMYEEALALAPDDNMLHGNFEHFLEAGGNLPQAIVEAQRVSELVPFLPGPSCYTGTLLVRQGRTIDAEKYFLRAVAIEDNYAQAYNELGLIALGRREIAEAGRYFSQALKADPNFADAYVNLGFLEQYQGNIDRALSYYDKAARLQPQGPPDYLDRTARLAATQRSSEAIDCFRTLLQQVPAFWQARYLFGLELAAAGKTNEAQKQFSEVLRCRPDYERLLSHPQNPTSQPK